MAPVRARSGGWSAGEAEPGVLRLGDDQLRVRPSSDAFWELAQRPVARHSQDGPGWIRCGPSFSGFVLQSFQANMDPRHATGSPSCGSAPATSPRT